MKDAFKILGAMLLAGLVIAAAGIGWSYMGAAGSVASAPARVVSKTMATDNIIANYEFFHDAWNGIQARVGQIRSHKALIAQTDDKAELGRLRMELSAMQQACRDLGARYNANATKTNRSIFMGREAPEIVTLTICEG